MCRPRAVNMGELVFLIFGYFARPGLHNMLDVLIIVINTSPKLAQVTSLQLNE